MKLFALIADYFRPEPITEEIGTQLNCCNAPRLSDAKTDLGHAESFEYMHTTCENCGAHWLDVFCVANGISGIHRIATDQAELMLSKKSGPELKGLIKAWGREHL